MAGTLTFLGGMLVVIVPPVVWCMAWPSIGERSARGAGVALQGLLAAAALLGFMAGNWWLLGGAREFTTFLYVVVVAVAGGAGAVRLCQQGYEYGRTHPQAD